MKATVERAPGSRVVLDIEVPPEEMAPAIQEASRRLGRQTRIPGFRPGKAPAALIERAVGRPRILQEALNPLVSRAFQEAVEREGLSPVDQPEIDVKEFEDGAPLHFVATVSVRPEVGLGDYRSVRVTPQPAPVGDEDIGLAVESLREARAPWVPVDGPAADGHLVILRTGGRLDSGRSIEAQRAEGVLGRGQLRTEVEEVVRGLAPGGTAEVDLSLPETGAEGADRERSVHMRVEVMEVKRRDLPELDDAWAAEVSPAQTLEELRADLGNRLRRVAAQDAEEAALAAAVRQLADGAQVDLPEVMVGQTVDNLLADAQEQAAARGVVWAAYLRSQNTTEEQLRAGFRPDAETRVRTWLVLEALARQEGLVPDGAQVEAEIGRRAAGQQELDPAHVRRVLGRPENRAAIAAELARTNALQWLREHALAPAEVGSPAAAPPGAPSEAEQSPAAPEAAAGPGAAGPAAEAGAPSGGAAAGEAKGEGA